VIKTVSVVREPKLQDDRTINAVALAMGRFLGIMRETGWK
jgi:hypothetical protein